MQWQKVSDMFFLLEFQSQKFGLTSEISTEASLVWFVNLPILKII